MPWVDEVAGIVHAWYLGNEVGNAIADILYGNSNPAGKLPLTFPVRIEDNPAFENIRSEFGRIHYREDLFVGYKHYNARGIAPLFPFGYRFRTLDPARDLLLNYRLGLVSRTPRST
jgi:beta-glucosidase